MSNQQIAIEDDDEAFLYGDEGEDHVTQSAVTAAVAQGQSSLV